MLCDAYLLRSASLGSPGVENLRWLQPVYVGDTLSGTLTVLEARASESRPGMGLVRSSWTTVNQHAQPVLAMEGWGMFRRRG
jgi:acyl dehydratase